MSAMQRGGKQIGNFICTHNDGDGTVTKGAEEGASDVRGLWARDGGGITGFPPHVTRSLFRSLGDGPVPVIVCTYEVSDLFPAALHGRHAMLTVLR